MSLSLCLFLETDSLPLLFAAALQHGDMKSLKPTMATRWVFSWALAFQCG